MTAQCGRELQAVRSVTAAFRMTNKPAPTGCSPFVPLLLEPLRLFSECHGDKAPERDNKHGSGLGAAPAAAWRVKVLEAVADKYTGMVMELLATVRAMDEALKKRKHAKKAQHATTDKGGGGGKGEKLSDADKIGLQLWLDAHAFGKDLAEEGMDLAGCAAYQQLVAAVAPFEAHLGRS